MSEIHNMQVILSQIPRIQKIAEHQQNLLPNGAQILNVVQEEVRKKEMSKVKEFEESFPTEREEPEKRRVKKDTRQKMGKLDIYG